MALDQYLGRNYELISSEGFDEYMKALDVNGVLRKVAGKLHTTYKLTKAGNKYTITSALPFKQIKVTFVPGVEFNQETPDGREVKSVITIDGSTITEVQTDENGKTTIIDRTFSNDEVQVVLQVDDIVAKRRYKSLLKK